MSFQRASDPPSYNLDVNEIAAILRQVQSGQLTLQQQQQQQQASTVANSGGGNIGSNFNQQGLRTGFEEDSALSLIHNSNVDNQSNYGRFSQPLRRPGRAPRQQSDEATLSKGALQKQIFATRLMGAPVSVAEKFVQNSGALSNIKPNLASSRPGFGTGSASSSSMGASSFGQQHPNGPPLTDWRPGMQETMFGALQKNIRPSVGGRQGNLWSTPPPRFPGSNGPYGASNIGNHSNQSSPSFSQTSSPQVSSSSQRSSPQINSPASASPIAFSQDTDMRHRNLNLGSSSLSNSPSMMQTAPRNVGPASSANFRSSMITPSTTSFAGVVTTASSIVGGYPHRGVGLMAPSSVTTSSYQPWQQGAVADARKRKLEDELAQFEMQVEPTKQMKTTKQNQDKSRTYLGGVSSGGAAGENSGLTGGADASEGSPYQWSTNFVHPQDEEEEEVKVEGERGKYDEIDVEGWIDSLVTYKKSSEAEEDLSQKRSASSERRGGTESSRRDRRRRRSGSPRRSRPESGDRRGSTKEINQRVGSAGRDRPRSPIRRRSRPRSSDRDERNRRSPVRRRADRSPRHEERTQRRERESRSPRHERGQRSPRRERGQRSPRHETTGRSPRQDHKRDDKSVKRSPSGRDAKRTNFDESNKGNQSVLEKTAKEDTKKDQTNRARDTKTEGEAGRRSGPGLLQKRNAGDEKKTIKINLKFQKGKDTPIVPLSSTYQKDKAEKSMTGEQEADKSQEVSSTVEDFTAQNVGDDSIQHQISLFTKLDMKSYVKNKQMVEWFCYLCQMPCNESQGYQNHVIDKKHKENVAKAMTSSGKPLFIKYLKTLPEVPDKGMKSPAKDQARTTKEADKNVQKNCYECRQTYTGNLQEHLMSAAHQRVRVVFIGARINVHIHGHTDSSHV
ncbi:uncharacterized protein [Amphiura filiformis]|uniref:uncharacterized protein n=1 Tax=Amphiura filiformis TaxID=82378 RepID=UPI003B2147B5